MGPPQLPQILHSHPLRCPSFTLWTLFLLRADPPQQLQVGGIVIHGVLCSVRAQAAHQPEERTTH